MSKPKHTPGPWKVEPFERPDDKEVGLVVQDQNEDVVAWLFQVSKNALGNPAMTTLPAEANANLIAAAPELLQLAYAFHTYLKDCPDDSMESLVKKTIAKAEGRE